MGIQRFRLIALTWGVLQTAVMPGDSTVVSWLVMGILGTNALVARSAIRRSWDSAKAGRLAVTVPPSTHWS